MQTAREIVTVFGLIALLVSVFPLAAFINVLIYQAIRLFKKVEFTGWGTIPVTFILFFSALIFIINFSDQYRLWSTAIGGHLFEMIATPLVAIFTMAIMGCIGESYAKKRDKDKYNTNFIWAASLSMPIGLAFALLFIKYL